MSELSTTPWLSVVIPAYNESVRLGRSLLQIREYVESAGKTVEVIVVDDGSTDGTVALAGRLNEPGLMTVRLVRNAYNRGKGFCVRMGMLQAAGERMLMTDADLSTPIGQLDRLLPWLERGCGVVIGSRAMPESVLGATRAWKRRVTERLFRVVRGFVMLPEIRDTQCGFKLFSREAARRIFERQVCDNFAFDCEVLGLARQMGIGIREVGVVWCEDPDSRLRPLRDATTMLASLLAIRWRLR